MEASQPGQPVRTYSLFYYILVAFVGSLLGGIVMVMLFPQAFTIPWTWFSADSKDRPAKQTPVFAVAADSLDRNSALQNPVEEIHQTRRTAIVTAVERVSPAVVSIVATQLVRQQRYQTLFDDPLFGGLLTVPRTYLREVPNSGSGVVISPDGYIVTNAHVVQNARRIQVVLTDGGIKESEVIGIDEISDLAVLRIEGDGYPAAPLGNSSDLMVGEWAIAIGNPLGLAIEDAKPAVTVGVVSAVGRDFSRSESETRSVYRDMIQTDASINPGNSGGPLINALGEVIGINTFIISESGGSEGIGFAIPIDHVKRIVDELIQYGKARAAWTGLYVSDITRFLAQELGIENRRGVLVNKIANGSPAARAGIQVMDIIREINGQTIANRIEARETLYGSLVGDEIELIIERRGQRLRAVIQIEEDQG